MIRARNALRADAACHSADVLTPVERVVESLPKLPEIPKGFCNPRELVYRNYPMKWGDDPAIRAKLIKLMEKCHAEK